MDGREAIEQIETAGDAFEVFVLDCTMPKVSGMNVYREIRSRGIKAPVFLISGYHQEQVIDNIGRDSDAYFVQKPFNIDELLTLIRGALQRRSRVDG